MRRDISAMVTSSSSDGRFAGDEGARATDDDRSRLREEYVAGGRRACMMARAKRQGDDEALLQQVLTPRIQPAQSDQTQRRGFVASSLPH